MSVSKIVPLTNVGLLSAAIERAHARPLGLPGLVVMYGASGLGKSVGAAFAANLHRPPYSTSTPRPPALLAWSARA